MSLDSHYAVFGRDGKPISAITMNDLDRDGHPELYDRDGYRVGSAEIPDDLYFPGASGPTPEELADAARILESAEVERVIRLAREAIDAALAEYSAGSLIPAALDDALAQLDLALRALPESADQDRDREPHPLESLNADRTDRPLRGVTDDELNVRACGMAV